MSATARETTLREAAMFVERRREDLGLNEYDCCDQAVDTVLADLRNDLHGLANQKSLAAGPGHGCENGCCEKLAARERLTLGKHEGAEDEMGGGGSSVRTQSPVLSRDNPARHPSDSLAQDEAEVERLRTMVVVAAFNYSGAEPSASVLARAIDDLASIARRLLKENEEMKALLDMESR